MLLNCHTCYSFCYGTLSIEELLDEIAQKRYSSFVLSDINNTSACIETVRLANEREIKPILGINFRNGIRQQYAGIARNNTGFIELNKHLTHHLHAKKDFDPIAPEFKHSYVVYPMSSYMGWPLRENEIRHVPAGNKKAIGFLWV
jgi:DNA polymerase-3 subunit alpha